MLEAFCVSRQRKKSFSKVTSRRGVYDEMVKDVGILSEHNERFTDER